jgi:hypothetical protein
LVGIADVLRVYTTTTTTTTTKCIKRKLKNNSSQISRALSSNFGYSALAGAVSCILFMFYFQARVEGSGQAKASIRVMHNISIYEDIKMFSIIFYYYSRI